MAAPEENNGTDTTVHAQAAPLVNTRPSVCRIVQLPPELILEVTEHLDPCDVFFLSQTCQALRCLTTTDWRKWATEAEYLDLIDFNDVIAYQHKHLWSCRDCARLHQVNYDKKIRGRSNCQSRGLNEEHGFCIDINYWTVQLALKYTRLEATLTSRDWDFLREMMVPREREVPWSQRTTLKYRSEPRIVDGVFLLHEEYLFYNIMSANRGKISAEDPICLPAHPPYDIDFCPHLSTINICNGTFESPRSKTTGVYAPSTLYLTYVDTLNAMQPLGYCPMFSCPSCATDCTAFIYQDEEYNVFALSYKTWSVLGSENRGDKHWALHGFNEVVEVKLNALLNADKGDFKPGEVRERWLASGGEDKILAVPAADDDDLSRPHPKHWQIADESSVDRVALKMNSKAEEDFRERRRDEVSEWRSVLAEVEE